MKDELLKWSGYDWQTRERWGNIHPKKPWNWYDKSCVEVKNNSLLLDVKRHPNYVQYSGITYYSENGTGLVCCTEDFGFGRFEIEAKLPLGKGLWPAFWMWATNAWPPEIDIFEGYSGERNYRGWFLKPYKVESCIHVRNEWGTKHIPAKSPWCWQFNNNPSETFNIYACEWSDRKIEFFINNKSIRKITDREILEKIAQYKMQIIINNHIDGRFKHNWSCEHPFEINYFKYEN